MLRHLKHFIEIIEGYCIWFYNAITGKTSKIAKSRLDICDKCNFNKKGICKLCGCVLKAKTRVWYPLDDKGLSINGCPLKKW